MESTLSIYPFYQPPSPPPLRYVLLPLLDFDSILYPSSPPSALPNIEVVPGGPDRHTRRKLTICGHPYQIRQLRSPKPPGDRAYSSPPEPESKLIPSTMPTSATRASTVQPFIAPQLAPPRRSSSQPPRQTSVPPRPSSQPPRAATPRHISRQSRKLAPGPGRLLPVVEEVVGLPSEDRRVRWNHSGATDEEEVDELEPSDAEPPLKKPAGDCGRPSRGGYTLESALAVTAKEYANMKDTINEIVAQHCDHRKLLSAQTAEARKRARAAVGTAFPELVERYVGAWPIDDFLNARLRYTVGRHREGRPVPQSNKDVS
ncbi:hypothetical protein PUNSTDRAFT_133527 [Punctularia strigosozonata HHB-11173 SS5]|uniref:uncharacterized protein n=1 Tax=Punctularia strigosozonata (strain HHB-11173) TaxID=741275 RepID=UPI0004417CE0|nr:uncharacterized protein PUNSTDRAFT_133527 [Punctularia strigosozonata HHB-11173 SS5]EIN09759.1 hypothetical protein PUNSTDRAFT_133527 [Punctularia strigosozonata HHB-11173 SS5]